MNMDGLDNYTFNSQEVIYEVAYKRISKRTVASILGCAGVCYLYTQSAIATIVTGILSTAFIAQGAVGHASLLTPSKKIVSLSSFSVRERSKRFDNVSDDANKNPRIQVRIKAADAQIKTIESSKILLSTSCSHGSSRLLARAGLPHASFPISLSPTLTAFYFDDQQHKDERIQVRYLNWRSDQTKIEIKIATLVERSLVVLSISFVTLKCISTIYGQIYG